MRRDQRRSVFVPDKTEDTEANGSIISSEIVSLNAPLWLMPFIHQCRTVALDIFSKHNLEGIVCTRKDSPYKVTERPSHYWIKIKNPRYSQLEGREELFDRG